MNPTMGATKFASLFFFVQPLLVRPWKLGTIATWNPKQPFINGCFNWMIPNLYIGNGCFTKHQTSIYKWLFRVPGSKFGFITYLEDLQPTYYRDIK